MQLMHGCASCLSALAACVLLTISSHVLLLLLRGGNHERASADRTQHRCPQVERGLRKLQAALADHPGREPPDDALLDDVLMDRGKPRPEDVPCTGASPEVEYQRSSIFVDYHTPEVSLG